MDFYEFYGDDLDWLLRRAKAILRDEDAAYDVLVDVWLKLKDADFSGVEKRKAFLRQTVKNKAIDTWRKNQRNPKTISGERLKEVEDRWDDDDDRDEKEVAERDLYDKALAEAIALLSDEHRAIVEIILRCGDDSGEILDELSKDADTPAERRKQKVRLHQARGRLFTLARVLVAVGGEQAMLESISELILDGDEHYDDISWGLNRCRSGGHSTPVCLQTLVDLGHSVHRAFWRKEDWKTISAVLRRGVSLAHRRKALRKLHGKYGTATVRTNDGVLKVVAKHYPTCTLADLRTVFRGSHLRLLLCMKDVPEPCRAWAVRLRDAMRDAAAE